ncbi:L-ascorbate peroxidase [Mycolicibacterium fortuitum subsp. acetamidolyticum]|uniref:L-ascorbate peroxidase n=1 Tax=Mycolicibacterium fortuitum subsp. acetamidolyticum TaxID=144550 RepID=A0A100WYL0_MYCFO|nr:L-ascorbate peroxidase [Mycolicibacterium fortuitum subsp. acetamidolyticum]
MLTVTTADAATTTLVSSVAAHLDDLCCRRAARDDSPRLAIHVPFLAGRIPCRHARKDSATSGALKVPKCDEPAAQSSRVTAEKCAGKKPNCRAGFAKIWLTKAKRAGVERPSTR